jgi:hypothetical protein
VRRFYVRHFREIFFAVVAIAVSLWIFQPAPLGKYFSITQWWIFSIAFLVLIVVWAILDKLLRIGFSAETPGVKELQSSSHVS